MHGGSGGEGLILIHAGKYFESSATLAPEAHDGPEKLLLPSKEPKGSVAGFTSPLFPEVASSQAFLLLSATLAPAPLELPQGNLLLNPNDPLLLASLGDFASLQQSGFITGAQGQFLGFPDFGATWDVDVTPFVPNLQAAGIGHLPLFFQIASLSSSGLLTAIGPLGYMEYVEPE